MYRKVWLKFEISRTGQTNPEIRQFKTSRDSIMTNDTPLELS